MEKIDRYFAAYKAGASQQQPVAGRLERSAPLSRGGRPTVDNTELNILG